MICDAHLYSRIYHLDIYHLSSIYLPRLGCDVLFCLSIFLFVYLFYFFAWPFKPFEQQSGQVTLLLRPEWKFSRAAFYFPSSLEGITWALEAHWAVARRPLADWRRQFCVLGVKCAAKRSGVPASASYFHHFHSLCSALLPEIQRVNNKENVE